VTPTIHSLGFFREDLFFENWSYDADGLIPYSDRDIQLQSFELYAQWSQLYRLTIAHQDISGATIAPTQNRWLKDGVIYPLRALEIDGYTPRSVAYTSQGILYQQSIGPDYGVPIMMPQDAVDAVIYYSEDPVAVVAVDGTETRTGTDTDTDVFASFFADDIPLAGVCMVNTGLTIE